MQINLKKFAGKPPTIACIRNDGSVTWQNYGNQGDFFPAHDLTHFAVETEMGYTNAFFGMIAAGRDIHDFGPGDAAAFHPEAVHAELLAGLLTAAEGRGCHLSYKDIKDTIDTKSQQAGISAIVLSERQLASIRLRAEQLINDWKDLPVGKTISLTFI